MEVTAYSMLLEPPLSIPFGVPNTVTHAVLSSFASLRAGPVFCLCILGTYAGPLQSSRSTEFCSMFADGGDVPICLL